MKQIEIVQSIRSSKVPLKLTRLISYFPVLGDGMSYTVPRCIKHLKQLKGEKSVFVVVLYKHSAPTFL